MIIFKIVGDKKTLRGAVSFSYYTEASTEKAATDKALEADPDILSWSTTELGEIQEDAYLKCPNCSRKIRNPTVWI
jgi:hypothetical protein